MTTISATNQRHHPAKLTADTARRRFLQRAASPAALLALAGLEPLQLLAAPAEDGSPVALPLGSQSGTAPTLRPFTIDVPQPVLDDLQARLARTRWPDQIAGAGWRYGTNLQYLQELTAYWQQGNDWRAQETRLNDFRSSWSRSKVSTCTSCT